MSQLGNPASIARVRDISFIKNVYQTISGQRRFIMRFTGGLG